ncbi:hypothetical protein CONLIGDRAFT_196606 [Coniochaeta ligniaria NRRL 30616]|uniref:BHLH domain-containing protein n=1 Tax=Coniochaeta ligniaria NRRL 30616 TaxID=1408157 RepID=A0A1J7J255_9PEZI|nr:hypothetical protein CONLIGDRAFT_196606 [Coniochaeta ligniaria NRRL 30616]
MDDDQYDQYDDSFYIAESGWPEVRDFTDLFRRFCPPRLTMLGAREETVFDGTLSPDDQVTFSGADSAVGSANHTMASTGPGRNRDRTAPPYSYASTISSARTGSRVPGHTNTGPPISYQYYEPATTGADDAWTTTSTSASGSNSMYSSDNNNVSESPFGSHNVVANPQHLQQQYAQLESQTSYMPPLASQSYAQNPLNLHTNPSWGNDFGFDEGGGGTGGTAGFNFSPTSALSGSGSNIDGSSGSPEMSGGSEVNFNGTAGLANSGFANYASASVSSAPVSPAVFRERHDSKRAKKAGKEARKDSISTSASSSARGGADGKQKRELRSASRTSKNKQERSAETTEEQKSRNSHNLVEKQYRNRLNAQFEDLLQVLPESASSGGPSPEGDGGDGRAKIGDKKRMSKAEVLDLARQRILYLEEENKKIERENDDLRRRSVG